MERTYSEIDRVLHLLAQPVAKFNRSFGAPKADDSHTNLIFDSVAGQLAGRWVGEGQNARLMVLSLKHWEYQLLGNSLQQLASLPLANKTLAVIEQEWAELLSISGIFSGEEFLRPLHFQIPEYPEGFHPIRRIGDQEAETWAATRRFAQDAAFGFLAHVNLSAEVRIWPHHFDTGVYVELNSQLGLGFGFAMQDSLVPGPYFYFSSYPSGPASLSLPASPPLRYGRWIDLPSWKGAVLEWPVVRQSHIDYFIGEVAHWYLH